MKQALLLLLFLTWGLAAAAFPAAADDLRDNRLQIDNSRIEKDEELNFGAQSERTSSLFNEADRQRLQEKQQDQNQQLTAEGGQLFSAIVGKTGQNREAELFQTGSETASKLQTNAGSEAVSSWGDFLPGLLYTATAFVLVAGTAFVSYRVATA